MPSRNQKTTVDEINKAAYSARNVVEWYGDLDFILKPEAVIIERIRTAIEGKKLLDIGIGAGRTTRFLLEVSQDYTGIDYTPDCIELAQKKYPAANLIHCDARDLSIFADQTFDFILFSGNGIDYMIHEDRMKCLTEIRRVLKPHGFFMFSTHNRDFEYFDKLPWREPKFDLNHLKSCIYTFIHLPRHLRMKKYETRTEGYAIINDTAHGFSLLTYYISPAEQVKQLIEKGFGEVYPYDLNGNIIAGDRNFPWTYYLARRTDP
jgi:ubiquinone/menaquinone biosynthesis C-methylase UbiE